MNGLPPSEIRTFSIVHQCLAVFGAMSALPVVMTGVLFYDAMVKNKIYMKLLVSISACDFIGVFPMVFGYPHRHQLLCKLQGIGTFLFTRASWMFTTWMVITLFTHVTYGRIFVRFEIISALTWGLSLIMFFLPLLASELTYGGNTCAVQPGWLLPPSVSNVTLSTVKTWVLAMFYGPLSFMIVLVLSLITYCRFVVFTSMKADPNDDISSKVRKSIENIQFYPLIMVIFWTPNCVVFLAQKTHPDAQSIYAAAMSSLMWGMLYPAATACYFFYRSRDARKCWMLYLRNKCDKGSQKDGGNTHANIWDEGEYSSNSSRSSSEFSRQSVCDPMDTNTQSMIKDNIPFPTGEIDTSTIFNPAVQQQQQWHNAASRASAFSTSTKDEQSRSCRSTTGGAGGQARASSIDETSSRSRVNIPSVRVESDADFLDDDEMERITTTVRGSSISTRGTSVASFAGSRPFESSGNKNTRSSSMAVQTVQAVGLGVKNILGAGNGDRASDAEL